MYKLFTAHSLSKELGMDRATLTRRLRDLEPVETEVRSNGAEVKRYAMQDVIDHLLGTGKVEDPDLLPPKERLDHWRGSRERDLYRKQAGELVAIDEMLDIWGKHVLSAKAKLLSIPMRLSPIVAGLSDTREIEQAIRAEVKAALEDLAKTTTEETTH